MFMIDDIEKANREAIERVLNSEPILIGVELEAYKVIPSMDEKTLLHAGPPITWECMSGPLRGAIIGAIIYEGWASTPEEAEKLAKSGEIKFSPNHEHQAVGPMAGVISPHMPVFIVKNKTYGNIVYTNMNEGLGKVLRYGAYDKEVIKRLKWMKEVLAPTLRDALKASKEGINLREIISQALHMGDECHNRNFAGTARVLIEFTKLMIDAGIEKQTMRKVIDFIDGNKHFFLNLSMAASKATMDAAHNIKYSTLVTVMTRNGTDFGIRVSGLGDKWFTAPAPIPKGLFFPGYSQEDANPDIGDSSITETAGLGGFAMAAAPAIVQFVGGTVEDAIRFTNEMKKITMARHKHYTIPYMNFEGTPVGIDLLKVIELNIQPVINTGIAHKKPGIGQIGAGIVRAPREAFEKAFIEYTDKYGI